MGLSHNLLDLPLQQGTKGQFLVSQPHHIIPFTFEIRLLTLHYVYKQMETTLSIIQCMQHIETTLRD